MFGASSSPASAVNADIPSYRRQAIALVLLFAALGVGAAWWNAHERQSDAVAQRIKQSEYSVTGTARAIENQIETLRKQITLLALGNKNLLEKVISSKDDFSAADHLRDRVRLEFPDSVAVTITSMDGHTYMEDFDGFIVEACRNDILHFVNEHHPPDVMIHPNSLAYHFDIMVEIPLASKTVLFFVSFSPAVIQTLLENGQLYGHRLVLLNQTRPGMIEVTVDGARDTLEESAYFLDDDELNRIAFGAGLAGTRWTLVDVPAAVTMTSEQRGTWILFAVELSLMLILASVLIALLTRSEHLVTSQHKSLLRQTHELGRSEARLRRAQDIAHIGYWDFNLATDELHLSDGVRRMLDVQAEAPLVASALLENVPENGRYRVRFALARAILGRRECHTEFRVISAAGGARTIHLSMELGRDPDGNPLSLFGIAQDITHWRHAEQAARDALSAQHMAESASLAKSTFLANMSHEIRTPLTAIIGFGETLLDDRQTPEDRHDAVRTIIRNGRHLLEIVNDILDLSKIEAHKLIVEKIACSPLELLSDVENIVRLKAQERGLTLEIRTVRPLPRNIVTDPLRFKQALLNLCGNAVKFTVAGSVTIEMSCNRAAQLLSVVITDSGAGMTPEQLQRVFTPFTQADASTTRRFGGTGLGLSIARQLAGLLGGEVTATSEFGVGSRFTLSVATGAIEDSEMLALGVDVPTVAAAPVEHVPLMLRGRVLLVEDTVDNQKLIGLLLRRMGVEYDIANDGAEGVRKATQQSYDVILMDMQMPQMDGLEATALLRTQEYRRPIVALTANAMTEDRERCLAAGCDDFIAKPVERQILNQVLARFLKPKALPREHTPLRSELPASAVNTALAAEFALRFSDQLHSLRGLARNRDFAELRARAQGVVESARGAGFPDIVDRAMQLDLQAAAANATEVTSMLDDLEWLRTRLDAAYRTDLSARRSSG